MPFADEHGFALSTDTDEAAIAYNDGVRLLLSAWPGADVRLEDAITLDPDFALAHAARARLHAISMQGEAARAVIGRATELAAARGTERERSHVDVLAHAVAGRSSEALISSIEHLERWPRDTLIMSLPLGAFGLYAFSGMVDHDQARVDLVERHADAFEQDDWWFLSYRGWALAENGSVARGRSMLERSIEIRRDNANGIHALAHAMHEGGAGDDADALISAWLPGYDVSGMLHGHIAWHAALVALDRGDAAAALRIYERQVHPSVSKGMAINVVSDAASLLWRVGAYGYAVRSSSWDEIGDYAEAQFPKAGHAFIDLHMAMIEAMSGRGNALSARISRLEAMANDGKLSAGPVVPTIARAVQAFAAGDYHRTVALLEPVQRDVARIGGSGAQREVVEDTLLVAQLRAGELKKAAALLDKRLHHRPSARDQRWRQTLSA